jgi:hypothetical protein
METGKENWIQQNISRDYFLNEEYIHRINKSLKLEGYNLDAVLHTIRIINSCPDLTETALTWKDDFSANRDILVKYKFSKYETPDKAPLLGLIVLLSNYDWLKSFYMERNIPYDIFLSTVADVEKQLTPAFIRNEDWHFESYMFDWLATHFRAQTFRIGVLHFDIGELEEDIPIASAGEYALHVHIPEGIDLDHKVVNETYDQARAFFAKYIPEVEFKVFHCSSWLTNPGLTTILDSSSKILKFQSDYTIYKTYDGEGFFGFIFPKKPADLNDLPENSRLQRAIKKKLLSGEMIQAGAGYFVF